MITEILRSPSIIAANLVLLAVLVFMLSGLRSSRRRLAEALRVDVYLASLERWPFWGG